jgi:repressor LexA
MPTIGSRLKKLRAATGKSQQMFAAMADSTQSSINRFENDQSEAPYHVLLWYADYFDVSMDYIYCRTDSPQGKLYTYTPETLKNRMKDKDEWAQFVSACFEEGSPLNAKLKESLINITGGESE